MKFLNILLILLLNACALNANYTYSIDQLKDFDLCFPESGRISILEIDEKIAIQKAIIEEKAKRNLTCDAYSNFVSGEEGLKSINQEELDRKLGKCNLGPSMPCRYD